MEKTYQIPEENYSRVAGLVDKLNRRADKLGQPVISLTVIRKYVEAVGDGGIKKLEIKINGETPGVSGWQFVGALQHEQAGNILRALEELPEGYRTASPENCDHCGYIRNRANTYVLRSENEYKQVGSTCLKDFTGYADIHEVASYAESFLTTVEQIAECEDELAGFGHSSRVVSTLVFLAYAIRAIEKYGWCSRGKAAESGREATADAAGKMMSDRAELTEADRVAAQAVIDYISQNGHGKTDYEWNLRLLAEQEFISPNQFGFVASMPNWVASEKAKSIISNGQHIGAVGEKITVKVIVNEHKPIASDYGVTHLYKMSDEDR